MRTSILILSALAMSAGVASADHWRGERGEHERREHAEHERAERNEHRWNGGGSWNGGWSGGVSVTPNYQYRRPVIVNAAPRYSYQRPVYVQRRPVYVQRTYPHHHYVNYYQRPSVLTENYTPMAGYIWSPGQWEWDGYQWNWIPGHYDPDPAYNSGYDNTGYDNTGYDNGGYDNGGY